MRSSLLALALGLAGCGNLHSLSLEAGSFATVRGHVDLTAIKGKANGQKLIAGIVWGALPSAHPICFEQRGDAVLDAICPDPFGFFPGVVDANVELDPSGDGNFELQLSHLPSASALIGSDISHVAYATLIVVADTDGNGRISLAAPRQRGGEGEGATDGGTPNGGGEGSLDPGSTTTADTPLAASFVTLKADQERLVFREGEFGALKLFYPAPACDTPATGFSVMQTGAFTDSSAVCDTFGLDHVIELSALTDADSHALYCRAQQQSSRTRQPDLDKAPRNLSSLTTHCIGKEILIATSQGTCPAMSVLTLSGCENDPKCEKTEWDERMNPPGWWPCHD